jgi:hypothetical protein
VFVWSAPSHYFDVSLNLSRTYVFDLCFPAFMGALFHGDAAANDSAPKNLLPLLIHRCDDMSDEVFPPATLAGSSCRLIPVLAAQLSTATLRLLSCLLATHLPEAWGPLVLSSLPSPPSQVLEPVDAVYKYVGPFSCMLFFFFFLQNFEDAHFLVES